MKQVTLLCLILAGCLSDRPKVEPVPEPAKTETVSTAAPVIIQGPQPIKISNQEIVVVADPAFAYTITSLTYRGYEFINADDRGREIQSALSFDDWGECYNPTEAGNVSDRFGTTSLVKHASSDDRVMNTVVDAAFWLPPGYSYPGPCGTKQPPKYRAQNTTYRDGYLIEKTVSFTGGTDNGLTFNLSYSIPHDHEKGTFEFTGYLQSEFRQFYTYDPATDTKLTLHADDTANIGEQPLPIIVSNGLYAMGVYSPTGKPGYGRWAFSRERTNKWNIVWRDTKIKAGDTYRMVAYVCVGEMDEVKQCMRGVYVKH